MSTNTKSHDAATKSHDAATKSHDAGIESHDADTKSHDAGIKSHDADTKSHDAATKSHDADTKSHDADTHIEIKSHDALLSHMITAYYILPTQLALYMKLTWQLSGTSAAHRQTGEVSKPKNVVRQTNKKKHGVESGKQHTRG